MSDSANDKSFDDYNAKTDILLASLERRAFSSLGEARDMLERSLLEAEIGIFNGAVRQIRDQIYSGVENIDNPLMVNPVGTSQYIASAFPSYYAFFNDVFGDNSSLLATEVSSTFGVTSEELATFQGPRLAEEAEAGAAALAEEILADGGDANNDGIISDAELGAWRPSDGRYGVGHGGLNLSQNGLAHLAQFDVFPGEDGKISQEDFVKWAADNDKHGTGAIREAWDQGYDADNNGLISAEELADYEAEVAEAARPLSSSEVAQLLRDQNYDIGEGIVQDLSEYERDIRSERAKFNGGFDWEDFVDPDEKNRPTGGRYSTVTRDPNYSGPMIDTDGDGIPDAEPPLGPQRQYELQKMYEASTDDVRAKAGERRQEDINERLPIENANFEGKSRQEILDYIDDRHRSEEELEALAAAQGYELTDADRAELIGNLNNADWDEATGQSVVYRSQDIIDDKDSGLGGEFDDLVITEEELAELAETYGYELSDADRRKYIGQTNRGEDYDENGYPIGGEDFVENELDMNSTTVYELRQIAGREGVDLSDLSDDEIKEQYADLIGNVEEQGNRERFDPLGTTVNEVVEVYKKRTGLDLSREDAQELLLGAEAGIHGLEGGNVSDADFNDWARDAIELDIGVQLRRMGTKVKDTIFGKSEGWEIENPDGTTTTTAPGDSKSWREILANILGVDKDGNKVPPAIPGVTFVTTGGPASWDNWLEILIPVPLPVQGEPLKIGLWENGQYIGPGNPVDLVYNAGKELVYKMKDGALTLVGELRDDLFSLYEDGTDIVRAVTPWSGLLAWNEQNGGLPEDEQKPLYYYDENSVQTDAEGSPIDPVTGVPFTEDLDRDRDGYLNDPYPEANDAFPDDGNEWRDSDDDNVGDNGDFYPNDPKRSAYGQDVDAEGNYIDPRTGGYVDENGLPVEAPVSSTPAEEP